MLNLKVGKVVKICSIRKNCIEVLVKINEKLEKAIAYNIFVNNLKVGNWVIVNTTAVDLNLGTGGYHYVLSNLNNMTVESKCKGHIMKLRYTPLQIKVYACEEQDSSYHEIFNNFDSLNNMPVLIGGLHSILPPVTVVLKKYNRNLKICYIMTDGGALPIDFSENVFFLKEKGYIDGTITIGHSFGGDYECVNIYNALIAAKNIMNCDICIVSMGPGIVGTGTKYGFTGIEQGYIIDAVNTLGGFPICIPRISFKDKRLRHFGLSHHTITVLSEISKTSSNLVIPKFDDWRLKYIIKQINDNKIHIKHNIYYMDFNDIINVLENSDIIMNTMGRNFKSDFEYFISAGVNAKYVAEKMSCRV
ncbi:Protein of unknown function [Caminicella sporogenes DSM 14501]|uniref:DUF3866 domain-containing protein n=1 Tax=Caminicella sporogenes DSM 14501 TaxID=1121266 RepID=A0A1M6LKL1_9FIRM|nr:DUF3866 family protein [Caminicella sporogenes]RKD27863.1 hypothetical protein BET04_02010 [Caminicella sporogenes]SHJ71692.1 Protein of unknown function [Caminicella sporogenes DSM 14501]